MIVSALIVTAIVAATLLMLAADARERKRWRRVCLEKLEAECLQQMRNGDYAAAQRTVRQILQYPPN
jgi:ABC-type protease/lipase transport system fused ATPase/permease subunit